MSSDDPLDLEVAETLARLRALGSPENVEGMKRYGVGSTRAFGVRAPEMRAVAREIGKHHELAIRLWATGWREARLVAAMISEPSLASETQMGSWAREFDSWDVCDGVCQEFFRRTPFAWSVAVEWSGAEETFVKRAGFVLMAQLAVHDKASGNDRFLKLLPCLERESGDPRPMVAKGINWALRQIGKRDRVLRLAAIACAKRIQARSGGRARWIASDAIRELESPAVVQRTDARR